VVVTPFTLAGAMAPVTMAGAVAQPRRGARGHRALQWIAPGCPVAIGTFTSNVDMKSGAPAFGTPEYMRATQMTGQMARFYGLPMRASGVCAANVPDGQAMWETANSLWSAVQSGTNMVYHAAGWLEGGLIASPEKFVMDCEVIQQIQRYFEPELTATTEEDIGIDAIAEVGAGGHFFGCAHTQERYTTAFYQPFLSDWRNFEAWRLDGAVWTAERANGSTSGSSRSSSRRRWTRRSARNWPPSWRGARRGRRAHGFLSAQPRPAGLHRRQLRTRRLGGGAQHRAAARGRVRGDAHL
jgi:trimethylamine--corrinoid protein Co-methyltransferase